MPEGDWVFVPTASPYSSYIVQGPSAGDPPNVLELPARVIMAGLAADRPAAAAAYNGCLYFETDTDGGTLLRCDGTTWAVVAPGVGKTLEAYKGSDQTVTGSTTLQNDSALSVSLAAATTYAFRAFLPWSVPGGSPGLKLALGGTVTATRLRALIQPGAVGLNGFGVVTALGAAAGTNTGAAEVALLEGSIETNAAGTLVVQWAQNTSDGSNGTTVQRGAWLRVTRLG